MLCRVFQDTLRNGALRVKGARQPHRSCDVREPSRPNGSLPHLLNTVSLVFITSPNFDRLGSRIFATSAFSRSRHRAFRRRHAGRSDPGDARSLDDDLPIGLPGSGVDIEKASDPQHLIGLAPAERHQRELLANADLAGCIEQRRVRPGGTLDPFRSARSWGNLSAIAHVFAPARNTARNRAIGPGKAVGAGPGNLLAPSASNPRAFGALPRDLGA